MPVRLIELARLLQTPEWQKVMSPVCEEAEKAGTAVFLVGGVVRSALLGDLESIKDIDITVEGDATILAEQVAKRLKGKARPYPAFLTARVKPGIDMPVTLRELDFASTRTETYPHPGARPVVTPASIEEDLKRRDFSVNALALPLVNLLKEADKEHLLNFVRDPGTGLQDLRARIIRVLHDRSFLDDPTRLLRALRYREAIKGEFEASTEKLLIQAVKDGACSTCGPARFSMELNRTLDAMTLASFCSAWCTFGFVDALPLIAPGAAEQISQVAKGIDSSACPASWRKNAFFWSCFQFQTSENYGSFLLLTGLGKKMLRRWEQDKNYDPRELSTPAALALHAGFESDAFSTSIRAEATAVLKERLEAYESERE